ncbi:hypothetical protein DO65_5959 [Burkholderia pseudomallei]|nr:hypothetical protein DO65_5959 [Burkholderia pseudomallei]
MLHRPIDPSTHRLIGSSAHRLIGQVAARIAAPWLAIPVARAGSPPIGPSRPLRCPAADEGLRRDDAIAPLVLRAIEQLVGGAQDFVDGVAVAPVLRHADAHGHGRVLAVDAERCVRDRGPHPLGDAARRVGEHARQQHHEFLAADARDVVVRANRGEALAHEIAQHDVADLMAVVVVDRLEVVEIEREQRERGAVAFRARDLRLHLLDELAPVGRARQRIGGREVLELLIGALELLQHALGARHRFGEPRHQVLLAVDGRERAGRHQRLHDAEAQHEEAAREDRVREPPHVIPRLAENERDRRQRERRHRDAVDEHQRRADAPHEQQRDVDERHDHRAALHRCARPQMAGDRRIRDRGHGEAHDDVAGDPRQPHRQMRAALRWIGVAEVRQLPDEQQDRHHEARCGPVQQEQPDVLVRHAGERAVQRIDQREAEEAEREPAQQRLARRQIAAPCDVGDEQPLERRGGDRQFVELMVLEDEPRIDEEPHIGDQERRHEREADQQACGVEPGDRADHTRRFMGCEDGAHGGLRNAVPGSKWEIRAASFRCASCVV